MTSAAFALGRFAHEDGESFPGLMAGDRVADLRPHLGDVTTQDLLLHWDDTLNVLAELAPEIARAESYAVDELRPLPPVWPPGQLLCAGANYRTHIIQMGIAHQQRQGSTLSYEELWEQEERRADERVAHGSPFVFAGLPSTLSGARDDIVLHGPGKQHDWEIELGVVIGRPAWRVSRANALNYVAGYTIANDISVRDVMHRSDLRMTDFVSSKLRPSFKPIGPWIVPSRFVPEPKELRLQLWVDGELMQDDPAGDMLFDIPRLIEYASGLVPLSPGDILITGSPAGNAAHHGNRWLRPGQEVVGRITGLGEQRARCVEPEPA